MDVEITMKIADENRIFKMMVYEGVFCNPRALTTFTSGVVTGR